MYAILSHGGRQYRVSAGDRLIVDRLEAEVGSVVALEPVLLTGGDGTTGLGKDLDGVRVAVTVIAHPRGRKLRIFKYKAKKRSRKMAGYRSNLTELRVESILAKGAALPKPVHSAGDDDTPRSAAKESPAAAQPAAKPRTRAAASATATDAPSAASTAAPTKAAPVRKSTAKRAATPKAAAPTADAVVVDEPDTAESEPAGSAAAKPKTAARTPKAAPKTSKRSTAAKDSADDEESGNGA
jgi:large subunit ribosomal protein L21